MHSGEIKPNAAMRNLRCISVIALLLTAFFLILIANIRAGSVAIPPREIFRILFFEGGDATARSILLKIRLPRTLMAAILGGALSLSGFLLQTYFQNPIAGPFVLGISSGAKMTVAVVMIFFLSSMGRVSSFTLIGAAFLGALAVTGFILLFARRIQKMPVLLVAGIMVGYICSAVTDFVVTFAEDADIVNLHAWSLGSFSGANWDGVKLAFFLVLTVFLGVYLLSKPIGALQMGEAYAKSMGVNIRLIRVLIILSSSLLSACVTAFAGPISFVGIAVPFLVKKALNTAKPLVVIPTLFLGGAVFCMLSDLIARTMFAPLELNVSTVTAVFGAPVVIFMMLKRPRGGADA